MDMITPRARIVAVLGPTNTGKTHLAMDRMLGHRSGMIGFPLRLLARENYDRAVDLKGRNQVALITGEEKIVPPGARYFLCTVESMPVDRRVAFLGVDEIQMCADLDRGHVFTDRLLNARGEDETMFMGADTIRPLIRRLVPGAEFLTRPRFSTLTYTGPRKVTRLAPRSAVVAFSAADVYSLAELVRRHRGGAAVVLGSLSPRTRNAQVAMYQAGEVDYLVATDAIGMGLNMDVDHVAFAGARKFDGRHQRDLTPPELAQIAGRAGRHMNDGTFGTTAEAGPLDWEVAERIENHAFDALKTISWRNAHLDFGSLEALRRSLARPPRRAGLTRAREADDEQALAALALDADIAPLAVGPDAVELLWDVCRIPDFSNVMSDAHARLLGRIYRHLAGPRSRLPADWLADQVARIERTDGDIETLVQRIANVRTWTYVSFRSDWLADAGHWQARTREVEDRLSDALHERLTQRFVDRRSTTIMKRMKEGHELIATVDADGGVLVEGHYVGSMAGFRFAPDAASSSGAAAKAAAGAALHALKREIAARVRRLEDEPDQAFSVTPEARLLWRDQPVARLTPGAEALGPRVEPDACDHLEFALRERVRRRLEAWLGARVAGTLAPLAEARDAPLKGAARGLVYQLCETLGSLSRSSAAVQVAALGREQRKALRRLGVRIGRESVYMPALLKPEAVETRALLWSVHQGRRGPPPPPTGRASVPVADGVPVAAYEAMGYRVLGLVAIRVDMLERLAARAWSMSRAGPFRAGPELKSLAGCGPRGIRGVLSALGYRATGESGATTFVRKRKSRRKTRPKARHHGRATA